MKEAREPSHEKSSHRSSASGRHRSVGAHATGGDSPTSTEHEALGIAVPSLAMLVLAVMAWREGRRPRARRR